MSSVTTFTLFRYEGVASCWRAFVRMGLRAGALQGNAGCTFAKLLGCGAEKGFKMWPNFKVYALMAQWESEELAVQAFENHTFIQTLKAQSKEYYTIFLQAAQSHGRWDGKKPFEGLQASILPESPMAVLTRATIRVSKLWAFWQRVAPVSASIFDVPGLIFTAGVGEWPVIQQATISIWESEQHMKEYAYANPKHMEVVRRTRTENWYAEELFCRFLVLREEGTWGGKKLLAEALGKA